MATPDTGLGFLSDWWQSGSRAAAQAGGSLEQAGVNALNFVEALGQPTSGRSQVAMATSAAKVGSNLGALPAGFGQLANDVVNLTNIITGVQQGGWSGYGGAAVNTAQLASNLLQQGAKAGYLSSGAGAIGQEIGQYAAPLASALSVYNFAKNWQSGATGQDALLGAQTGATIGSEVLPGVGTIIGGVVGAGVGALSSAFGGGRADPETMALNNYAPQFNANPAIASQLNPAQNYQLLSGIMDAKNNSPGHSTPQEQYYGRMAESAMMNDIFTQVNSALSSGRISPNASAQQIYQQVVSPYFASKGMGITSGWPYTTAQGNNFGNAMQAAITNLIGQWQSGQLTSQSQIGISGQTDPNMPTYGGQGIPPQTQQQNVQTAFQPVQSAFASLGAILGGASTW